MQHTLIPPILSLCLWLPSFVSAQDVLPDSAAGETSLDGRYHALVLDDGAIRGTISTKTSSGAEIPVSRMELRLLRRGQVVQRVTTGVSGAFEFTGIGPGVYGLYGYGGGGFIAFSIELVDEVDGLGDVIREIDTLAIPPTYNTIGQIIQRHVLPSQRTSRTPLPRGEEMLSRGLLGAAHAGPSPFRLTSNRRLAEGAAGSSVSRHPVNIDADGQLHGTVHLLHIPEASRANVDHSRLTAILIQNDREVSRTSVEVDGRLTFTSVQPGAYGYVVAGVWNYKDATDNGAQPAFGAFQIDAQSSAVATNDERRINRSQLVSHRLLQQNGAGAAMPPLSPENLQALLALLPPELRQQLASLFPGAFPGGFGAPPGGGGGGGGGGGFPLLPLPIPLDGGDDGTGRPAGEASPAAPP